MRGNPAESGGPLTSKPAWPNSFGGSTTPAFFSWMSRSVGVGARTNPESTRLTASPRGETFTSQGVVVMKEETCVIEREPEAIQAEVEETRGVLTGKLGTLEQGIKDTWHGATAGAARAAEGVKSAATTTLHAMQGAVHSTGEAMGRAFDMPAHVRRHPWLMLG